MQKLCLYLLFILGYCSVAHAELDIVITKGRSNTQPIAVLPFDNEAKLAENKQISKIIGKNLTNSGYFYKLEIKPETKNEAEQSSTLDLASWRKRGAVNVIVGKIEPLSKDTYKVSVQLLDTVNTTQRELLNKQYTVNSADLRTLAHHISDEIYAVLVGEAGIFSTRIAYILVQNKAESGESIYTLEIADADGANPRTLLRSSQPIMSPAWSPDGKKMAYVSFENRRAEIFIVDIASGRREKITGYPGINNAPAWSPDGKKLAVTLSKEGYPDIYIVDIATKKLERITQSRAIDTESSWAADGQSLIFTSDRGGNPQIYRVKLSDKSVERVTFEGNYNASATFSPNAKDLVLLHRNGEGFNIAIQDIQSGYVTPLTRFGHSESPSIAPNGRMVLYASQYAGKGVLNVVSTDGRVHLRLPAQSGDVQEPAWSPFNKG